MEKANAIKFLLTENNYLENLKNLAIKIYHFHYISKYTLILLGFNTAAYFWII